MDFETIFWLIHLPLMVLFAIGLADVAAIWFRRRTTSSEVSPTGQKLSTGLKIFLLLKAFIIEAWFNRRLWETSRWRWLSHFLLLNGFLLLTVLSGLAALSEKVLKSIFHLGYIPWISMWYTADHPIIAFLNEIGGLMMTLGLLFYIVRRYIIRPPQLRTSLMDTWIVVALGVILLSGWITEIVRLNAGYEGSAPYMAFIGYPLSRLVSSWGLPWESLYKWLFLSHGLFTSIVIVTIPYSKFLHAVATALTATLEGSGQKVAWEVKAPSPLTMWHSIALDSCTRCGECIRWCPTFAVKPQLDAITPLRKIETVRQFVRGQYSFLARLLGHRPPEPETLRVHSEGTYSCTLCGRCSVVCPAHIQTRQLWIAMRQDLVQRGVYPAIFDRLRETFLAFHNISGDDNSNRLIWSQNMPEIPAGLRGKTHAEVVYFVGCVASFYPMCYSIPQSVVQLLEKAGVDYTSLGGEEWCCGFPLIIAGMGDKAVEAVHHNVEAVRRMGAQRLVTSCPSCYHTWKHDYPHIIGESLGFEVLHITELLAELLKDGAFSLRPLEEIVTYHDPCDLGRTSGVYDAPRTIIQAIPGITMVEMEHHRQYSLCCGGGGDVEMADKELVAAVAQQRIKEAQATGAKILLSACQQCKRTLTNAARQEKIRIRVMDVTELMAQQAL